MAENTEATPEQQIAALKAQLEQQQQVNADQQQVIEEQHAQINEIAAAAAPAAVVITVDKRKYQVVIPSFRFEGKKHTAESLSQDRELQKELVKVGSGVLKEIV